MPVFADCEKVANEAGYSYGVPGSFIYSILQQESGCRTDAVSPSGALGIAQIIPKYHPGVNPLNPAEAIDYLARKMSEYFSRFGSYGLAAAAWHSGERAVAQSAPCIPKTGDIFTSTINYVRSILSRAGLPVDYKDCDKSIIPVTAQPSPAPFPGIGGIKPSNIKFSGDMVKIVIVGTAGLLILAALVKAR